MHWTHPLIFSTLNLLYYKHLKSDNISTPKQTLDLLDRIFHKLTNNNVKRNVITGKSLARFMICLEHVLLRL